MRKLQILAILFLALSVIVPHALAWTWEDYEGTTQWKVIVTEDETNCGADEPEVSQIAVSIVHNKQIAEGNFAHGKTRGSFTGNTLSIPQRTIADGSGNSVLHSADLLFSADCLSFSGTYRWDYTEDDPAYDCRGTTALKGTRIDAKGCPQVASGGPKIADVRAQADMVAKETLYKEILAKDPQNFWANWDMAELRKKQGNYKEYFSYFDKAMSNKDIFDETKAKLKEEAAHRLHLSKFPTPQTSPLLRVQSEELESWNGGMIYDEHVPKEASQSPSWKVRFWALLVPDSHSIVDEIVGLPPE